jgi:hypothetical protein
MCRCRRSHRVMKSCSARKKSPTSAWRRSTSSTRKTPRRRNRASRSLGVAAVGAAVVAVAEAAAAGAVADAAAGAVAGAASAGPVAAAAAAGRGAYRVVDATPANAGSVPSIELIRLGPVRMSYPPGPSVRCAKCSVLQVFGTPSVQCGGRFMVAAIERARGTVVNPRERR